MSFTIELKSRIIDTVDITFEKLVIIFCILWVGLIIFGIAFTAIGRNSRSYRIDVNGRTYACNTIEYGNPVYLGDCWKYGNVTIYDPINMVVRYESTTD